mgnify:FL=1
MVVEAIINALSGLFLALLSVIDIPDMPESIQSAVATVTQYLGAGYGVLSNFVDMSIVGPLLLAVVVIDAAYHVYLFVMWILRKLPFLGMS